MHQNTKKASIQSRPAPLPDTELTSTLRECSQRPNPQLESLKNARRRQNCPTIKTGQDHALGTNQKRRKLTPLANLTPDTPCRRATVIPSAPRPRPRATRDNASCWFDTISLLSNLTSGNVVDADSPNPVGHSLKIPRRNQQIQSQRLSIKCLESRETTARKALVLHHLRDDCPILEATTPDQLARRYCPDLPLNPYSTFVDQNYSHSFRFANGRSNSHPEFVESAGQRGSRSEQPRAEIEREENLDVPRDDWID